ncbi:Pycsar system effector family protein [Pedobacter deserti]|uniref:Pycsar system effector family protein n=1 Tax=Pedobacter deserti TaxID=2817382 RepID=UPI00210D1656|nr:Pycsar system effector family protein [Pedobacter sp. SYSU D00382]
MALTTDQIKFIIQRYDTYIGGANTKGAFLLAFNSFLCGGLLSNYKTLITFVEANWLTAYKISVLGVFILGVGSLVVVLLAIFPFLKSGNSSPDRYHSLIYFGSVSMFDNASKYQDALQAADEQSFIDDASKQAFQLATGLRKKYNYLSWATVMIFIQLALVLAILSLILFSK